MTKSDSKKGLHVIDYIGAKNRLAPVIWDVIERNVGVTEGAKFAEFFGGTAAVSRHALDKVARIDVNDLEMYSKAICMATIGGIFVSDIVYEHLNDVDPKVGFISETCSPIGGRNFFTIENAVRIDGMKSRILEWYADEVITVNQTYKMLGDLVIAADRVSNVASVYGAYLKKFKKTALKEIKIVKNGPDKVKPEVYIHNMDAFSLASIVEGDILYLDPPYNQRQYGANYFVLNYIAGIKEGDYIPTGKSGIHKDWKRSEYCNGKKADAALDKLMGEVKFEFVVMSYSNKGVLPISAVKMILGKYGKIIDTEVVTNYRKFKADNGREYENTPTNEYIIVIKKG